MQDIIPQLKEWATLYGIKIVAAVVILIVGLWISKSLRKFVIKLLTKKEIDATIVSFVGNIVYAMLITFVVIVTLSQVGIETTSFIAVLGAAGLAVGFALQGALSNFAAGFLIILFRPFKAGDFIDAAGSAGTVQEVQILYTQIKTPENIKVVIPNGKLMSDIITNYSANETRRAEWIFGIGYNDDIKKARSVIKNIIESDQKILTDPAPQILVKELADSSVNFAVRAFISTTDFWNVYFETTEKVKNAFDENKISIPFPQRDVHTYQMQ
jgi:small conductance mechanosensitive channel